MKKGDNMERKTVKFKRLNPAAKAPAAKPARKTATRKKTTKASK